MATWKRSCSAMRAMRLMHVGQALVDASLPELPPGPGQISIDVLACGVCRTDLHVVDGELPRPSLPLTPGHEIVGRVSARGPGAERFALGALVGVPWLAWTCGTCPYCRSGRENLCERARFTGYTVDGGYAEQVLAEEQYCLELPSSLDPAHAAPLLCAGLIGYRSLRLSGDAQRVGLYGFGAAAHIVAQVALHQGRQVFAFVRPGDEAAKRFAEKIGVHWAGDSTATPPAPLDAAIIYAPVGQLVPIALRAVAPGGSVICAGIHMSDIPAFPYELLWRERSLSSVANLTRRDGVELMQLVAKIPIETTIARYDLRDANRALSNLRAGAVNGAAVLIPQR